MAHRFITGRVCGEAGHAPLNGRLVIPNRAPGTVRWGVSACRRADYVVAMSRRVRAALAGLVVAVGACTSPSSKEIGEKAAAADAVEKQRAHDATVRRLTDAKADADKAHELEEPRTAQNNIGQEACKRIAAGTRACVDGKQPCTPVGDDGPTCAKYMQVNNLERNPF